MEKGQIRWIQRLENYRKALAKLKEAVRIVTEQVEREEYVDELLEEGLVQRFEYTHELAWKVMKDYEQFQGYNDIMGSRDAIRRGLNIGIISDENWVKSIEARNISSHAYDEEEAEKILFDIINIYFPLMCDFEQKMKELSGVEPTLF